MEDGEFSVFRLPNWLTSAVSRTLFSVFGNVVKRGLSCLIYYVKITYWKGDGGLGETRDGGGGGGLSSKFRLRGRFLGMRRHQGRS